MSSDPDDHDDAERELRGVLHDVANALTVLLGWVGEARAPGASLESVAFALRITEQRARGARDMARRVLGVPVPATADTDELDVLVDDTLAALAVEAQHAGVTLAREGSTGARVPAAADLSHVLTNLLLNAVAHAPRESRVRVTLGEEGTLLHVDVEDEGPGVAPERRESVFRGDTTRAGGAGVGLRHARASARSLGGDVAILPSSGGARFRVSWPKLGNVPTMPPPAVRSRALEGRRILVLEDDVDVTGLLETALGSRGAEVVVARAEAELPAALARGPFHAVLVDLSPIAGRVEETVARLHAASPGVQVVFITGNAASVPQALLDAGASWVRKPFEVGEVVAALSRPASVRLTSG